MQSGRKIIKTIIVLSIAMIFQACNTDPQPVDPPVKEDATLKLDFTHSFNGKTVDFNQNTFVTGAFDTISPTNFKLLFSKIRLVKMDDTEITFDNRYGYVNFKEGKNFLVLPEVPAGQYKAVRFFIGLDSIRNFGDPAQWASDHPLNPNLNGMHWGWAGGYIFMTHEGTYKNNGANTAYTFHIATIPFGSEINIDVPYTHSKGVNDIIEVNADLSKYFDGVNSHSLKNDISGSHSRTPSDAPFINKIRDNIKQMFSATMK